MTRRKKSKMRREFGRNRIKLRTTPCSDHRLCSENESHFDCYCGNSTQDCTVFDTTYRSDQVNPDVGRLAPAFFCPLCHNVECNFYPPGLVPSCSSCYTRCLRNSKILIYDLCISCRLLPSADATFSHHVGLRRRDLADVSHTGCGSFSGGIISRLFVLLAILLTYSTPAAFAKSPPPNYSQSNMPKTNFTCADKATGGYYADPEAHCQMFHVCVRISDDEMNDFRFVCPNDTVFDQQNFICTNWWEIDCERSTRYYSKNDLFREGRNQADYEYEYSETPAYYEYVYEYDDSKGSRKEQTAIVRPVEDRHRLTLSKSISNEHSVAITEDTLSSTVRMVSPFFTSTAKETPSTTPRPKLSFFTTPTQKAATITTRSTTVKTTTPEITTHRPVHRLAFDSPSGRTTAPPSVHLNSRGRPIRGRTTGSRAAEATGRRLSYSQDDAKNLDLDSEDPFSIYDWKRESSGVTASARTRYETLFGATSSRGRMATEKQQEHLTSHNSKSETQKENTNTNQKRNPSSRARTLSNTRHTSTDDATAEPPKDRTKDKHQEFSNFRFYKTAFGRSYSSDDYLGTSSGTTAKPLPISEPVRPERTASRNTRYSIYGR